MNPPTFGCCADHFRYRISTKAEKNPGLMVGNGHQTTVKA